MSARKESAAKPLGSAAPQSIMRQNEPNSPNSSNSFTFNEAAQRRANIANDHSSIQRVREKETEFWNSQHEKFEAMLKRMRTAQITALELNQYLVKSSKVMTAIVDQLNSLSSFGSQESFSLKKGCEAHDVLTKSTSHYLTQMRDQVGADSIKQSNNILTNLKNKINDLETIGRKNEKAISSRREAVDQVWNVYEQNIAERQKAESLDQPVKFDPVLPARQFHLQIAALKESEAVYRRDMSNLFSSMQLEDGRRIDSMKSLLLDNLMAQKAIFENASKFADQAIAAVKLIDREADVKQFILDSHLVVDPNQSNEVIDPANVVVTAMDNRGKSIAKPTKTSSSVTSQVKTPAVNSNANTLGSGGPGGLKPTVSVFELTPPLFSFDLVKRLHEYEVEKEGALMRQGKIIKSNWKQIQVTLSKTGFFHYFANESELSPSFSIDLRVCTVSSAPHIHPNALQISQPNSGLFNLSNTPTIYYFRANTLSERDEWLSAMRSYSIKPSISSQSQSSDSNRIQAQTRDRAQSEKPSQESLSPPPPVVPSPSTESNRKPSSETPSNNSKSSAPAIDNESNKATPTTSGNDAPSGPSPSPSPADENSAPPKQLSVSDSQQ